MSARTRIKCSGCGRRIPRSEPDLVLQKFGSEKKRYFHRRCADAAMRFMAGNEPAAWHLTDRFVDEVLN